MRVMLFTLVLLLWVVAGSSRPEWRSPRQPPSEGPTWSVGCSAKLTAEPERPYRACLGELVDLRLELVTGRGRGLALSVDLLDVPALGLHRGGQGSEGGELAFLGDNCGGELRDDLGDIGRGPDAKTGALKLASGDAALAVLLNGAEGAAVRATAQGLEAGPGELRGL